MYFEKALESMKEGKVVQLPGYQPIQYVDGVIKVKKENGYGVERHDFSSEEILSHEWKIVEEPPEVRLEYRIVTGYTCPHCNTYFEHPDLFLNKTRCRKCGNMFRIVDEGVDVKNIVEIKYNSDGMLTNVILK